MTEYQIERSVERNMIREAVTVFAKINRAHESSLYLGRRDRELVETRGMVWAYLKENTKLTMSYMGKIFNRHHSTVICGIRVHKKNMGTFTNGKAINPLYVDKYEEGSKILDQMMAHTRELNEGLIYRVVLYTDDPVTLNKFEVVNYSRV